MLFKKSKGVEGSIFGPRLSRQIVEALDKRFPGEPLKILGRFTKTEIEARIALAKSDEEVENWEKARKEFSNTIGMSFEDVLSEKDLKTIKGYLKEKNKERKTVAEVYKNLRDMLIFKTE